LFDAYYDAFSRFMRSGTPGELAGFCDGNAELAVLDVYRNGFLRTCTNVLRSNYPSVDLLVGETCFTALARHYIEVHPPREASLVAYGEDFARIIQDTQDLHRLDYLASVAMLDRAWTEVYFAADAEAPTSDALAGMTVETIMDLSCRLVPAVRLESLEFDALDAWSRLRQGALENPVAIRRGILHVLIWRSADGIVFRALTGPEHAFVAGIAAGQPCAEAALAAVDLNAAFDIAATFAFLLQERILNFEQQ